MIREEGRVRVVEASGQHQGGPWTGRARPGHGHSRPGLLGPGKEWPSAEPEEQGQIKAREEQEQAGSSERTETKVEEDLTKTKRMARKTAGKTLTEPGPGRRSNVLLSGNDLDITHQSAKNT